MKTRSPLPLCSKATFYLLGPFGSSDFIQQAACHHIGTLQGPKEVQNEFVQQIRADVLQWFEMHQSSVIIVSVL